MKLHSLAFIQNFGAQELILIFLVVLLFFGANRLPELFRSFGKSIKEFKKATSDIEEDIRTAMDTEEKPKSTPRVKSESATTDDVTSPDAENTKGE